MKYLDEVRLLVDREEYAQFDVKKGATGTILMAEIRNNKFEVEFIGATFWSVPVFVGDLEVIRESNITNEDILSELPQNNPAWWCKVENGYIVNLNGEHKNKIPYDYNS